jgi:peptidoglycan/LPS O-acetylase OafA/YrhL
LRGLACELAFVQNYGSALWNHTWSLAVEEHFYLLLAVGLFVLAKYRSSFALVPVAFVVVALLCLALRIFTNYSFSLRTEDTFFPLASQNGWSLFRRSSFVLVPSKLRSIPVNRKTAPLFAGWQWRPLAASGILFSAKRHALSFPPMA